MERGSRRPGLTDHPFVPDKLGKGERVGIFLKDPTAAIDYAIDWSAGYLGDQSITASNWQVAPIETGGVTVVASKRGAARTSATLGGGIAGHVYRVTNRIVLTDTRSDKRTITVRVDGR